jgi:hypothetical protein
MDRDIARPVGPSPQVPLLMDGEVGYILTVKRSPEPS